MSLWGSMKDENRPTKDFLARVRQSRTRGFTRINLFSQEKGLPFLVTSFRRRRVVVITQSEVSRFE
jgi:hypothetical protein